MMRSQGTSIHESPFETIFFHPSQAIVSNYLLPITIQASLVVVVFVEIRQSSVQAL
jgi:hypothetical protein